MTSDKHHGTGLNRVEFRLTTCRILFKDATREEIQEWSHWQPKLL